MKHIPLAPLCFFALGLLPLAFFSWKAGSILKTHIARSVVNDPPAGLSRDLKLLSNSMAQGERDITGHTAWLSGSDNYKKYLSASIPSLPAFRVFGKKLSGTKGLSLVVLTDGKADVLYSNPPIPRPSPSVTPVKKSTRPKTGPILERLSGIPGMDRALAGDSLQGFFRFQGSLYQGCFIPITNRGKVLGTVLLGTQVNAEFVQGLRAATANELALYSMGQTWCSSTALDPPLDYESHLEEGNQPFAPNTLEWKHANYLAGGFPLSGLDGKPLAFLAAFQPVHERLTVEGNPQKTIANLGHWTLLAGLLLALVATWYFQSSLSRLGAAIKEMKEGNSDPKLPVRRRDEWGSLARSLKGLLIAWREKERVSLILGKVVSPQVARNILEAKDLFALKGERREVTLLHADLRGFNTLSENMDPPVLVEALNQYFTLINEIVFKHEGMLDKFIGETAVALWGAPFVHDDKEPRAVQAALEIQEAMGDFNIARIKKGQPPFTLGIGIHTGIVVSGNLGSDKHSDYTVIGEPLHLAARLCAMAAPGQTVVSEETYLKVKSRVKSKPLNPLAVPGSMEPLKTYEITGFE